MTIAKVSILVWTTLVSGAAVSVADPAAWQSGRRNGTVHGPGTLARAPAEARAAERRTDDGRFALLAAFDSACGDDGEVCRAAGVDHSAAGAGLRRAGWGTIRLRGVPAGATLEAAFLYVGLIELVHGNPGMLHKLTLNGAFVPNTRVGRFGEHCWEHAPGMKVPGEATLYRARVDPLILPDINGDYAVAGVPSAVLLGDDPFRCEAPGCHPTTPLAQGATLIVIWRHPSVPPGSQVYIHEANPFVPQLTSALTVNHTLVPAPLVDWKTMRFTSIGGDGQTRDPDILFDPVAPISTFLVLGGLDGWIRGLMSLIEPNMDWTGLDGGTMPQLWDTRTTTVYASEMSSGLGSPPGTYQVHYQTFGGALYDYDCVNPSVHVLGLQAP